MLHEHTAGRLPDHHETGPSVQSFPPSTSRLDRAACQLSLEHETTRPTKLRHENRPITRLKVCRLVVGRHQFRSQLIGDDHLRRLSASHTFFQSVELVSTELTAQPRTVVALAICTFALPCLSAPEL